MNQPQLKRVLLSNSVFSIFCAIDLLLFTESVASLIGNIEPIYLQVVGIGLIVWSVDLAWVATRKHINTTLVKMIIVADLGWVLGTAALLFGLPNQFNDFGVLSLILVASAVLVFALLQVKGLSSGTPQNVAH
ncbi:hypothetical protein A9Q99_10610 [Gammaproteobacteria bacterium 45_16_T64]|nr:hypothetical protein A9Q99_10610 [Gammaproteobacteria bacterium 45_16_T64]